MLILLCSSLSSAADNAAAPSGAKPAAPKIDPHYPFRTDFANQSLPWYQMKPGEFPPHHSDHRVSGELVSVDHIRRKGQFRTSHTGELRDFTMLPYGAVRYLNTEADLRDVPLGRTGCSFSSRMARASSLNWPPCWINSRSTPGMDFRFASTRSSLAKGSC